MDNYKTALMKEKDFKCEKCGYYSPLGRGLEVLKEFKALLCDVCVTFAPEVPEDFSKYLYEKTDWRALEPLRKFSVNKLGYNSQKRGMIEKSCQGKLMTRPPFGYKVIEGNLVPNEDGQNVRLIFEEFSAGKSLNQIAKVYSISVNGIKKILKNFAYLGKVKFSNQISQGSHTPLISAELFNRVQSRFESLAKKN